jgi:hypothetical protein
MEGAKKITVMIAIFAVVMLRVTSLKIRKLSCTRTFHSALRPFVYGPEVPVPQPPEI